MSGMKKRKNGVVLAVALATLAALSSFSLSAFAQSAVDQKLNVTHTETTPPAELSVAEKPISHSSKVMRFESGTPLNEEQAKPFIETAIARFKDSGVIVPGDGYKVAASLDEKAGTLSLLWSPVAWDELGPLYDVSGTVYSAKFIDVDLTNGTGELDSLRDITDLRITREENSNTLKLKFPNNKKD